jgi:hypothetical protein
LPANATATTSVWRANSARRRKVKKLKRLIGRSVVHGQHSGAGGVPVRFHRGSAQRGRYGLGAHPGLRHRTVDQGPPAGTNIWPVPVGNSNSNMLIV